jgi:hypothetical protein
MSANDFSLQSDAMLADQREVLDYWTSLKRGEALPRRGDFRPGAIVRRLPQVSLVDVDDARRFRFRLAGTGLRDTFGEELTGRRLDEISFGQQLAHWQSIYTHVADCAAPANGFLPLLWKDRPSVVQAWLRLPFADADGQVKTVLGYDRFLPVQRRAPRQETQGLPSWDGALAAIAKDVYQSRAHA